MEIGKGIAFDLCATFWFYVSFSIFHFVWLNWKQQYMNNFFYWYSQCVRHTSGFLTILSVSVCTKLITNKLIIITRASNTCRLAESSSLLLWWAKSFEINSNGLGLLLLWSSVLDFVNIFWKERRLEMFLTMCQWQTIFRLLILLHYSNKYQGEHLEKSIKKCGFAFNLYVHSS